MPVDPRASFDRVETRRAGRRGRNATFLAFLPFFRPELLASPTLA